MRLPRGETWTRLRRKFVLDPYSGEMVRGSWADPDRLEIEACAFAPALAREFPQVDREQLADIGTLYMPYQSDVTDGDRVEGPDGRVWSADASRSDWRNPYTGRTPGSTIPIKRWRG